MQGREKKKKGQIRQSFGGEVEGLQRGFDWGEPSDLPMYPATAHRSREREREPTPNGKSCQESQSRTSGEEDFEKRKKTTTHTRNSNKSA
jgi:hypothetical protein